MPSGAAGNLLLTDAYEGNRRPLMSSTSTPAPSNSPVEASAPQQGTGVQGAAAQPAGVHSLWRLRGYLRSHVPTLVIMLVTALAGVCLSIAIPLVTKAMIDGPITDGEIGPVLPLGLLALALGSSRRY